MQQHQPSSSITPAKVQQNQQHHVVIVGGGFGGLYAAKKLGSVPGVRVTLVDRRNFHLFQPLLYQVATGYLSPSEIASPLRNVLKKHKNVRVLMAEVTAFDIEQQRLELADGTLNYDSLILATGSSHSYFGNDQWSERAPGLKTLENALDMRQRILAAFESAEREELESLRREWLNFVIVGGGPTGVELAGAIAELAKRTFTDEFRAFDPSQLTIRIVEGSDRLLSVYSEAQSAQIRKDLEELGVTVQVQSLVTNIENDTISIKSRDGQMMEVRAKTVLWAAGVKASPLGQKLAELTGAELDRMGRVLVRPDLSVPGYPNLFVIGDLANFVPQGCDKPLPGVAPVAIQEGDYVAGLLKARIQGKPATSFKYQDRGSMAVIGKNKAVARIGKLEFSGFPAWFLWMAIHILHLVEFDNQVVVAFQWTLDYFFRKRSARLITAAPSNVPSKGSSASTTQPVLG